MRFWALHWAQTRRMRKCYGARVAKTKGKSQKGKAAALKAVKPAKTAAKAVKAPVVQVVKATILKAKETVDKKSGKTIVKAVKPAKATKPSLPPPPPGPPPPPPPRDELPAPRDIARLTRYGERFGERKIDVRWLPIQLPVTSGAIGVMDPGVAKSFRVLDRPSGSGQFRAMLSIARTDDGKERIAAITVHVGRPPITRWTVAHWKGQKTPKSADQLPRVTVTSGWLALIDAGKSDKDAPGVLAVPPASGIQPIEVPLTDGRKALALPCGNGEFAAYWAVDATDKPICLVVDFDVFTQKEWKSRPTP